MVGCIFGEVVVLIYIVGLIFLILNLVVDFLSFVYFLNLFRLVEILVVYIWKLNFEGVILDVKLIVIKFVVVLIIMVLLFNVILCLIVFILYKCFIGMKRKSKIMKKVKVV